MSVLDPTSDRSAEPTSDVVATGVAIRADVVRLVRERRYEEALSLLYAARADAPDSAELAASIRQIKEFLIGSYAKKLGGLDRVARAIPAGAPRFPDALLVARYIDGASTFDDISQMSPLGRLRTLQVLVAIYVGAEAVPPLTSTPAPPLASTPASPVVPSRHEAPTLRVSVPPPPAAVASAKTSAPPPHEPVPDTQRARGEPAKSTPAPAPSGSLFTFEIGRGWRAVDAPTPAPDSRYESAPRYETPPPPPVSATFGPWGRSVVSQESETPPPPPVIRSAPPESPEDAEFKAAFARGTAAFIQRRYGDAIDAFRACERLRPADAATATMLRRALQDAERV